MRIGKEGSSRGKEKKGENAPHPGIRPRVIDDKETADHAGEVALQEVHEEREKLDFLLDRKRSKGATTTSKELYVDRIERVDVPGSTSRHPQDPQ
jgi:hypothetical protein